MRHITRIKSIIYAQEQRGENIKVKPRTASLDDADDLDNLYKRLLVDCTFGLDKLYIVEEIQKAKASPTFVPEYHLKYLGGIGNVLVLQI